MKNFGITTLLLLCFVIATHAQADIAYKFKDEKVLKVTPVKDQNRTGTCWAFAATSFIEAELLRMGKGEYDLSEMFFVRKAYERKADNYVRMHGVANFSQGGQAHDVFDVLKTDGFVTEKAYAGIKYGEDKHVHSEMSKVLKGVVDAIAKNPNRKITPVWRDAFSSVLDVYMGGVPNKFDVGGKSYSAVDFVKATGFNPEDYVEITSYTNYPFYKQVNLQIPDNWNGALYYNVPLDDLMKIINQAVEKGYSVCWDGDVSEKGFSHKNNIAIIPEKQIKNLEGMEMLKWDEMSESQKQDEIYSFKHIVPEVEVDQRKRQETFDNQTSTDDHLMHLYGRAKDQNGTVYYLIKNSWDTDSNDMGGNLYMSESFVKMKTIAIMVHKDAIPKQIKEKMKL